MLSFMLVVCGGLGLLVVLVLGGVDSSSKSVRCFYVVLRLKFV